MIAASDEPQCGTNATPTIAALRTDVFDDLTTRLGATSEVQRADLLGIDRGTVRRMRRHQFAPRLSLAMRMAKVLGTTVEMLFELESAA